MELGNITYAAAENAACGDKGNIKAVWGRARTVKKVGRFRDNQRNRFGARGRACGSLDKVGDHHAIIPTEEPVNLSKLTPEERNIYDLVVRRVLAVLSPVFKYEETKLAVQIDKERFYAKGKIVKSLGWKKAYDSALTDDDADDSDIKEQSLPQIRQGEQIKVQSCAVEDGKTKPPSRYNEATLLTAMENPGNHQMSDEMRAVHKNTSWVLRQHGRISLKNCSILFM